MYRLVYLLLCLKLLLPQSAKAEPCQVLDIKQSQQILEQAAAVVFKARINGYKEIELGEKYLVLQVLEAHSLKIKNNLFLIEDPVCHCLQSELEMGNIISDILLFHGEDQYSFGALCKNELSHTVWSNLVSNPVEANKHKRPY